MALTSLLKVPLTTETLPNTVSPSRFIATLRKTTPPDTTFPKPVVMLVSISVTAPVTASVPFLMVTPDAEIAASPLPLIAKLFPARSIVTPAGTVSEPFTLTGPVSSMTAFSFSAAAKSSFGPTFTTSGAPPLVSAGTTFSPPSPLISSSILPPYTTSGLPSSVLLGKITSADAEIVKMLKHRARIRTTEMSFDVAFISVLLLYRKIKSYEFEITSQRQIAPFSVVCQ